MPRSTGPKALLGYALYKANLRDVNAKASIMHQRHIKKFAVSDLYLYNGLFAHTIIYDFAIQEKVEVQTALWILIISTYKVFHRTDAYVWGIVKTSTGIMRMVEREKPHGMVETMRTKNKVAHYYLNLKGQDFVKRFHIFYDKRVKEILKSNANDNYDIKYKYCRKKPAKFYQ